MSSFTRALLGCIFALALTSPSFASVLTVGPGGTYPSVAAALATVVSSGSENEIHVAAGVVSGPIAIDSAATIGTLTISGGWNSAFTTRSDDPSLSVLDGGGSGPVVQVDLTSGKLILIGLTIRNGVRTQGGAGVDAQAHNGSGLIISNCRIENNRADGSGTVDGGGLTVWVTDTSALNLGDTVIVGNVARSTGSSADGGGLSLTVDGNATANIHGCRFVGNSTEALVNQATGGGLDLYVADSGSAAFRDNLIVGNSGTTHPGYSVVASGAALWTSGSGTITSQRNVALRNTASSETGRMQLSVLASGTSTNVFADGVVANSSQTDTGGIEAHGYGGTVKVINSTVASNGNIGIASQGSSSPVLIANCILYGNQAGDTSFDSNVTQDHDIVGTDPMFVDPTHDDFRLLDGSPAIDAGNDADRSGLDTIDLMGMPRLLGFAVDCGAHEHSTSTTRLAAVTHTIGFNGTPWRADIAVSNPSTTDASVAYTYREGGNALTISDTVPAGTTKSWGDFLVDRFGKSPSVTETGALQVFSSNPALMLSSRTYANPAEAMPPAGIGTYGQYLDGLGPASYVPYFGRAVIPLLRNDANFYTNIGFLNAGSSCTVGVQLYDANGVAIGSMVQQTVANGEWGQINDVFGAAGAGQHSVAYAFVGVPDPGDEVWFYASVIDRRTKDPTTVPVVQYNYAPHSYRLPAVAHLSGAGGTPWRTALAVVNVSTQDETLSLIFRGSSTIARTVSLPAGHTMAWDDLLVDLFGLSQAASDSGSVEIQSDKAFVAAARSYADMGSAGTYGQFLPAQMLDHDGITPETPGTLQHIRADAHFYTNVGLLNMGSSDASVRITLRDANGMVLGAPVTSTVPQGRWVQVNDVFSVAGAGTAAVATATVEVLTPGGLVSGYASVIDRDSRDPTTVPLLQAFAVWPGIGDPNQPVF